MTLKHRRVFSVNRITWEIEDSLVINDNILEKLHEEWHMQNQKSSDYHIEIPF